MNSQEKQVILEKAKIFFRDKIVENHIKNIKKLKRLKEFNVNPFLDKYLASCVFGDASPENIAKALVYARILGTSITTIFGNAMQSFCNEILSSYASIVSGIDIEFVDAIDGRKKYCQIKSGPNTINKDDVTTIKNHFTSIKNLARTNRLPDFNPNIDCVVGVFYGNNTELSGHYKKINEEYPVVIGQDFWHRLTGDENFYLHLIDSFAAVALEMDSTKIIQETINLLTEEIKKSN